MKSFLTATLLFYFCLGFLSHHRFKGIVIHHAAFQKGNFAVVEQGHRKRFGSVAYHLILSNGSTDIPLGYLESGLRYKSLNYSKATRNRKANLSQLHLCLIGNYHTHEMPMAMKIALGSAMQIIHEQYGLKPEDIKLHRDCGATECPGKYITKDQLRQWLELADQAPEEMRQQQRAMIGQPFWGPIPIGPFIASLPFVLLAVLLWFCLPKMIKSLKWQDPQS